MLNRVTLLVVVAMVSILTVFCSSSDPENIVIDLSIKDGKLEQTNTAIKVKKDDIMTVNILADQNGTVHLHGYDLETNVGPDIVGKLEFVAEITGNYPLTIHAETMHHENSHTAANGVSKGHGVLFDSPLLESDHTFKFTIPIDIAESTIFFHNHMKHDMSGQINVDTSAQNTELPQIVIGEDGSFEPSTISVQPGTTILWINKGSKLAQPTSGTAPMVGENNHGHGHSEAAHSSEDEVKLGTIEVHPR